MYVGYKSSRLNGKKVFAVLSDMVTIFDIYQLIFSCFDVILKNKKTTDPF